MDYRFTEQEEARFVVSEIERLTRYGKFRLGDFAVMYRTNAQSRVIEEAFIRYGLAYNLVAGTRFYERREVKDIVAYLRIIRNPQDTISLLRIINVPVRGIGQQTIARVTSWARMRDISLFDALCATSQEKNQPPFDGRARQSLTRFFVILDMLIKGSHELDLPDLFDQLLKEVR